MNTECMHGEYKGNRCLIYNIKADSVLILLQSGEERVVRLDEVVLVTKSILDSLHMNYYIERNEYDK